MISFFMEKHLHEFSARTLLDIGPGYSSFGLLAARLTGAQAISILDFDQSVIDWQTAEYGHAHVGVASVCNLLTVETIARLSGCYDLILCQEVLEHLPNAEEILTALGEKLAVNGRIVVTVPTKVSERWLKWLNPSFMVNEAHGHVRQFDENALRDMLKTAGLSPIVFVPTQPHFFLSHTWLFGTRMQVESSTGKVSTKGVRSAVFHRLNTYGRRFFMATGPEFWGRQFPRNYFVVATRNFYGSRDPILVAPPFTESADSNIKETRGRQISHGLDTV
jgi:SAM-dependent methyltransferase